MVSLYFLDCKETHSVTTPSASIPLVSTIFGLTYLALAVGKVPGLRIDRGGIALVGGRHARLRRALDG